MNNKTKRPWLGDFTAPFYDWIMENSVFPRKFHADFNKHTRVLSHALEAIHSRNIIEIGTGSGISADFLPTDNHYTGIDISPRLLKRAMDRFRKRGFCIKAGGNAVFHRASAESILANDSSFDFGICLLTLNFIQDKVSFLQELFRVLGPGGRTFFCVPCLGLLETETGIRGEVLTGEALERLFGQCSFTLQRLDDNGALLYFDAVKI